MMRPSGRDCFPQSTNFLVTRPMRSSGTMTRPKKTRRMIRYRRMHNKGMPIASPHLIKVELSILFEGLPFEGTKFAPTSRSPNENRINGKKQTRLTAMFVPVTFGPKRLYSVNIQNLVLRISHTVADSVGVAFARRQFQVPGEDTGIPVHDRTTALQQFRFDVLVRRDRILVFQQEAHLLFFIVSYSDLESEDLLFVRAEEFHAAEVGDLLLFDDDAFISSQGQVQRILDGARVDPRFADIGALHHDAGVAGQEVQFLPTGQLSQKISILVQARGRIILIGAGQLVFLKRDALFHSIAGYIVRDIDVEDGIHGPVVYGHIVAQFIFQRDDDHAAGAARSIDSRGIGIL